MMLDGKVAGNMIEVKDAHKSYDAKSEVLRGLNMQVERGTIYAFLGPSGCGKTTLLKCIVGRMRLDAGEIILGVKQRSQIGYMPQETALVAEITIKETLSYYGWMYGLKGTELEKRKQELYGFLNIPPETQSIKKLSGGQKRRVSLCVALLNNPDLMILDEPTVGIDPLLSYSIWQCLLEMSNKSNKTILLTTHYIEEARQAHKVGMMRGGCLLAEGEATNIMKDYNCDTLDQVFMELSSQQETMGHSSVYGQADRKHSMPLMKPKLPLIEGKCFSFSNFISLLLKNLYFLKYTPLGWFLILFVPVSSCILFEFSIGQEHFNLKLGVVNEELDHNICNDYNSTCHQVSCIFITQLLENQLDLIFYQDVGNAHIDAKRNLIWGYLHFPHNFTQSLYERVMKHGIVDEETLAESEVSVWVDMSNQLMGYYLKKSVYSTFENFLNGLSLSCRWPIDYLRAPIRYNHPIYGGPNINYSEFSMVGMLMMLEFFLPMTYAAALMEDKVEGILERSFIAGHTAVELVVAHVFVATALFIIETFLCLTIFYGIFNHVFYGNIMLALFLLIMIGIAGIFYGVAVALLFDNHSSATNFVLGTFIPLTVLSGMVWPIEGMHHYLRSISWFLPLTHATEAYRSIAVRSWTINHPTVYVGFLSVFLWVVVSCFTTVVLVKTKRGIAIK